MPTLTQGSSASVSVTSGQYVTLKNVPTAHARIEFASGIPAKVHHSGANVYGPFNAQTLKISAVAGSVDYSAGALASIRPLGRV
jgi:hypothetical protein